MGLINSSANGATERPGSSNESIMLFLGGPIRYWWRAEIEGTELHKLYVESRDKIFFDLSEDYLVYAPHRAIRGPWDSRAQLINDAAVARCDAFINLNAGVPMDGTRQERSLAQTLSIPVIDFFVGKSVDMDAQLREIRNYIDRAVRRRG